MRGRIERTPPAVSLRVASPADAPAVAALCGQLGYPSTTEQVAERLRRIEQNSAEVVLVAALASAEIAGWIQAGVVQRVMFAPYAEVGGLVVDAPQRGLGIGRALLDAAERWARERGCTMLRVRSNVVRHQAHRVYTRLGYALSKTQRVFERRIADEEP